MMIPYLHKRAIGIIEIQSLSVTNQKTDRFAGVLKLAASSSRTGNSRAAAGSAAKRARAPARAKRSRAGRPAAGELERRKAKVMVVATDMFIARGYASTSLLDIARKAGVATRTLYQHFGDKEAIFGEVICAKDAVVVDRPVVEPGESLASVLQKTARYCFDVALRPRSIELMRLMIAESARFSALMSRAAIASFVQFKANVADVFRQLAVNGVTAEGDHDQSAQLFIDLLLGNCTVMIYFGWISAPPTDSEIAVKVDLFARGRFSGETIKEPAGQG